MSRKTMLVMLIVVIIAGAIAGTFVFLSQGNTNGSTALPSFSNGMGGTSVHPAGFPGEMPQIVLTVPADSNTTS